MSCSLWKTPCAFVRVRAKKLVLWKLLERGHILRVITCENRQLKRRWQRCLSLEKSLVWPLTFFRLLPGESFASSWWSPKIHCPSQYLFPSLIKLVFAPHLRWKILCSDTSLLVLRKILNDKTVSIRHCILFETTVWNKGMETELPGF